ncbi:arginine repressor [Eubacteriales bacterium OttesenSCG-928-N14]|nr:arginine repressor [Eubacteriales bacterium OttesenSCG-928-N14]
MKNKRHEAILQLIEQMDIETQDELAAQLKSIGFQVTQATISRDIKELRLIKVLSDKGIYKYAQVDKGDAKNMSILMRMFTDTVQTIEACGNLVIIKTMSGSANAAAEAVDSLKWPEIAGTLAGDNTIFLAVRETASPQEIVRKLKRISR